MFGAEFWLFVALAILIYFARKPVGKALASALDGKADAVRKELDEATRLREEAQAMLADYQRKLHEGQDRAEQIIKHAEEESERLHSRMAEQMENTVKRRTDAAMQRIAQEEQRAVNEVRGAASSLAVQTTRKIMEERLAEGGGDKIMARALGEVKDRLH
ncbi:MAG: ATP F0F1 synthase subunit B [Geminicoccaceae bacterium]